MIKNFILSIDIILTMKYNQTTVNKYIFPDEVKGRFPQQSYNKSFFLYEENRWSNLKKEPFFKETFRYKDLLWMELWKVLWFCQSRRRSNAFRLEIQRTYRQIEFVYLFVVCPFYIH